MRIYIDFDGVINAHQASNEWGYDTIDTTEYKNSTFVWSETVTNRLRNLTKKGTITWVTTWPTEDVETILRLLGFGKTSAETPTLEWTEDTPYLQSMASAILTNLQDNPLTDGEMWAWLTPHGKEISEKYPWFATETILTTRGTMGYIPHIDAQNGISKKELDTLDLLNSTLTTT